MATVARFPSSTRLLGIKTDQPECFRCDTHSEGILKCLQTRKDLCDVVLIVGDSGERISAHRLILIAASDYFSDLLSQPMGDSPVREIIFNEVDEDSLEKLVKYCYTGSLELRGDEIEALLITANHLRLKNVVEACCEFLQRHLKPSNCLAVVFFAEKMNLEALLQNGKKFICKNFEEFSNHPEFFLISAEQLNEFIASDDLVAPSEEFIFGTVMKWIDYDPENRKKHFTLLLAQIRLPLLPPTFLAEKLEPLCNFTEIQKFFVNALKSHLQPTSNSTQSRNRSSKNAVKHLLAIFLENTKTKSLAIADYNLRTKVWTIWNTPMQNIEEIAVALMADSLIVVGGNSSNGSPVNTVTSFNLHTMTPGEMAPLVTGRSCHSVAMLNGSIYAIGGWDGDEPLNSVERWDPVDKTWSFVAPMKDVRYYSGVAVLNNRLYVSGGDNGSDTLSSVECYDPVENIWRSRAPMKVGRRSHCLAVHKGYLFAFGGYNSYFSNHIIERYDPRIDTWTTVSCSQTITGYSSCASFGSDQFIHNNSNIYTISSEGSCDDLKLQLLFTAPDALKEYCWLPLVAISHELSPPESWIEKKGFQYSFRMLSFRAAVC